MMKKRILPLMALAACFGVLSVFCFVQARVIVDESYDFDKKVEPLPEAGPFTGKIESDMEEIPQIVFSPISDYQLKFNGKKQFVRGGEVNIDGSLTYLSQADAEIQKLKEKCENDKKVFLELTAEEDIKDTQKMEIPSGDICSNFPVYRMPALENTGIFVQVWRKDENEEGAVKGDFLVDEFYAEQGFRLEDGKEKRFEVDWKIPPGVKGGKYYFSFYVDSNIKYSVEGLPVVAGDHAALYEFDIAGGDQEEYIEIDKDNVTVNGQPYVHRAPSPVVEPINDQIVIELPVKNITASTQEVNIDYEVTRWRQEDGDVVVAKKDTQTINAGEAANARLEINTKDPLESVYHIRVVASTTNSISTYNIHLAIKDRSRGLFTFLGMAEKDNVYAPIFCIRNRHWVGFFDGSVKISLSDQNGKEKASWEKSGKIRAGVNCFAVKDPNLILTDKDCIELKGEIVNTGGETVDQGIVDYNCEDSGFIPSIVSRQEGGKEVLKEIKERKFLYILVVVMMATGIILLILNKVITRKDDK